LNVSIVNVKPRINPGRIYRTLRLRAPNPEAYHTGALQKPRKSRQFGDLPTGGGEARISGLFPLCGMLFETFSGIRGLRPALPGYAAREIEVFFLLGTA